MATLAPASLASRHATATAPRAGQGARRCGDRTATRVRASALNERVVQDATAAFAIPNSVAFELGKGGLPLCVLTHKNGSRAEVYLFGANVTSWCQPSGDEVLYVRPDAVFDKSKPISGGVPICFPQFGPGPMQQHGFARNLDWSVISTSADVNPDDPEPSVLLKLRHNAYTREMWNEAFEATYEVTLRSSKLMLEFSVRNPGEKERDAADARPITFTAALHTYVEVADASMPGVFVRGLAGKTYLDKAADVNTPPRVVRTGDVPFGGGLVDQVYLETEAEAMLHVGTGAAVSVENTAGWTDTAVWNPHTTLPGDMWKSFCCVESLAVSTPVVLQPDEVWRAETNLSVVDL
uniref:glucose-6-phosphate 1-epimerase n=1 Tax=Mantoniella antarctica TaxID=81844 RepID=A0A7S0S6A0_9CHLO